MIFNAFFPDVDNNFYFPPSFPLKSGYLAWAGGTKRGPRVGTLCVLHT